MTKERRYFRTDEIPGMHTRKISNNELTHREILIDRVHGRQMRELGKWRLVSIKGD